MRNFLLYLSSLLILTLPLKFNAEIVLNSEYEIPSVPINKNISLVIRVLCFDKKILVMASNSRGADLNSANEPCGLDGNYANNILEQKLVYGRALPANTTGIVRKFLIRDKYYFIYTGKSGKPVIEKEL